MKKLILLVGSLMSISVFSADIPRHKAMTLKLNEYDIASRSSAPNKALVYFSSSTDVDKIDWQEVTIDGPDISDGKIEITRATSPVNGHIVVDVNLTSCQTDLGEVTIQPNKLIIRTDKLPVRVFCSNNNGSYREFYTTIYKP